VRTYYAEHHSEVPDCRHLGSLDASGRLWTSADGSLSATLKDQNGAVVAGATITLVNTALKSEYKYKAVSYGLGFYSFPTLPVGHCDLTIEATGFKTQKKTYLTVDTDAALELHAGLTVGQPSENITVAAEAASVEAQVDDAGKPLVRIRGGGHEQS
jgi:hypothetical protein